ncbi:MAG: CHAT domain-containing protein [bacterium]|nr:CHAT domain-containing protein [bacterium]
MSDAFTLLDAGGLQSAVDKLEAALNLYRQEDRRHDVAGCLIVLGMTRGMLHGSEMSYEETLGPFEESRTIFTELMDPVGLWMALFAGSAASDAYGRYDEALEKLDLALEELDRLESSGKGLSIRQARLLGAVMRVPTNLAQALQMMQPLILKFARFMTWHLSGLVHHHLGDNPLALKAVETAWKLSGEMGPLSPVVKAELKPTVAAVCSDLEEIERSKFCTEVNSVLRDKSVVVKKEDEGKEEDLKDFNSLNRAHQLLDEAFKLQKSGDLKAAVERLEEALKIYRQADDRASLAGGLVLLGSFLKDSPDLHAVLAHFEESIGLLEELGDHLGLWTAWIGSAELCRLHGYYHEALIRQEQAFREIGKFEEDGDLTFEKLRIFYLIQGIPPSSVNGMEGTIEFLGPLLKPLITDLARWRTHRDRGLVLFDRAEYRCAQEELDEALRLNARAGEVGEFFATDTLTIQGAVYLAQGDYEAAEACFEKVREASRKLSNTDLEAQALIGLGEVDLGRGRYPEALSFSERALELTRLGQDHIQVARALILRGGIYLMQGQRDQAMAHFEDALQATEALYLSPVRIAALANISTILTQESRYEDALENQNEALSILRQFGNPREEGKLLLNLAETSYSLGRIDEAASYFDQSFTLARKAGDRVQAAFALSQYGMALSSLNHHEEARVRYEASLAIVRDVGDRRKQFEVLLALGWIAGEEKRHSEAITRTREALDLARQIGYRFGEGAAHLYLGIYDVACGREREALAELQEAQSIFQDLDLAYPQALTLASLAAVEHRQGHHQEAAMLLQGASDKFGSIAGEIHDPELVRTFSASLPQQIDRLTVAYAVQRGEVNTAFGYAERSRAQSFLRQVASRAAPGRDDDPLLTQERRLHRRLLSLGRELSQQFFRESKNPTRIQLLRTELGEVRSQYKKLMAEIKKSHPEYASLRGVEAVTISDVQQEILDSSTTLISYYLADGEVVAWVIDQESAQMISLEITPEELEHKVRWLRQEIASGEFDFEAASDLYRSLFGPLKTYVRHQDLIVIPHGVLHYLPFAVLWDGERKRYLIEDYTLSYGPSASALRFLRAPAIEYDGSALILGDPDGSLPEAGIEARRVAEIYGTEAKLATAATERLLREQAGKVDVLHVAAHGIYTHHAPQLSYVELSPDSEHDGKLEIHEIFDLPLEGTQLVVLSACNTALGELNEGDDIVGLTRAFLYAGSPAVVITLWPIEDEASAVLMEAFHRRLHEGRPASEALQQAQLQVLTRERWRLPYYWSAFTLTGRPTGSNRSTDPLH